jgi:5-methylcytosine-specific restriction endonuclease McrA
MACENNSTCSECGKAFYRHPRHIRLQMSGRLSASDRKYKGCDKFLSKSYCGPSCLIVSREKTWVHFNCDNCGKSVSRRQSQLVGKKRSCSRKCNDKSGLIGVPCSWPGCCNTMMGRSFGSVRRGIKTKVYKIDLRRRGDAHAHPICGIHELELFGHGLSRQSNKVFAFVKGEASEMRGCGSLAKRVMIAFKSDYCCSKCKSPLKMTQGDRWSWQVDHIIPVLLGGDGAYDNMQALCVPCHDKKSSSEKSIAGKIRGKSSKSDRWLTHSQKDAKIFALLARIKEIEAAQPQLTHAHKTKGIEHA